MNDLHYYQYAFVGPDCRVQEIGPGVDSRFDVELIGEGPIAAVVSQVGLDQFAPEKLQGKTPGEIRWLGQIAARHNEIICQAANSSAVLPLRLGTVFRTRDSLRATLSRHRPAVADFLRRLGDRQEWGIKLYFKKCSPHTLCADIGARSVSATAGHAGPPTPHCFAAAPTGTDYLTRKKAELERRLEVRAVMYKTLRTVEERLSASAEHCCRIRALPGDLTGRSEEMVFNAAYLLPSSVQEGWLATVQRMRQEICRQGLLLEVSGPWPPYHFCPNLEL